MGVCECHNVCNFMGGNGEKVEMILLVCLFWFFFKSLTPLHSQSPTPTISYTFVFHCGIILLLAYIIKWFFIGIYERDFTLRIKELDTELIKAKWWYKTLVFSFPTFLKGFEITTFFATHRTGIYFHSLWELLLSFSPPQFYSFLCIESYNFCIWIPF